MLSHFLKSLYLSLSALILPILLPAEELKINLKHQHNDDNSISVYSTITNPGTYSYIIVFSHLENTSDRAEQIASLQGDGEICRLNPISKDKPVGFSTYQAYVFRGLLDAKINKKVIYRLPFSLRDSLQTQNMRFQKDSELLINAYNFVAHQGDTIFAVRKGTVVDIKNEYSTPSLLNMNSILIEHEDGTICAYECIQKNSFMVKTGDIIFPGTPLALVGTKKYPKYEMSVRIYYPATNLNSKPNLPRTRIQDLHIVPTFATTQGNVTLENKQSYKSICPPEVVIQEMSRKEKKAYLKSLESHK